MARSGSGEVRLPAGAKGHAMEPRDDTVQGRADGLRAETRGGPAAPTAAPDDEPSPAGSPSGGRLVLLGLLTAFGPLSLDLYLPALPAVASELRITESSAQLTMSACMIGLAVGQVVAGPLSDRLGRKRPLVAGLVLFVALSLACAAAPTVESMVALRLVQGMAGGTSIVIARSIVRDTYGVRGAARAFSLLVMAAGLAPIVSPILGGLLLTVTSWRGLFIVLAALTSLLLIAAAATIRESLPPDRRHSGGLRRLSGQARLVFTDRTFLGAAAVQCLSGAGMFTFISMSAFVFQGHYGLDAQGFGLLFGGISLGIVTAARMNAWAVGRYHPASVMRWGVTSSLVGALSQAVAVQVGAPGWVVAACVFVTIASGGLVNPNCQALALRHQRERTGTASGLLGLMQFGLGAAVGPLASLAGATPVTMSLTMACTALLMTVAFVNGRRWLRED